MTGDIRKREKTAPTMFLTMQAYYLYHGNYVFRGRLGRQDLGETYQDEDEKCIQLLKLRIISIQ